MSPGNESIPSPVAALFGFDIKSTAEKKNHPLTKAGKTNKVRRTNYARIKKDSPLYKANENPWGNVEWLKMIKRPEISNQDTFTGKWIRRKFRILSQSSAWFRCAELHRIQYFVITKHVSQQNFFHHILFSCPQAIFTYIF
jgi:hypothetical protein